MKVLFWNHINLFSMKRKNQIIRFWILQQVKRPVEAPLWINPMQMSLQLWMNRQKKSLKTHLFWVELLIEQWAYLGLKMILLPWKTPFYKKKSQWTPRIGWLGSILIQVYNSYCVYRLANLKFIHHHLLLYYDHSVSQLCISWNHMSFL